MTKRLTWDQFLQNAIPSARKCIFIANEEILERIKRDPIGFYQFTKKTEYEKNSFKCGQTHIGAIERIAGQRNTTENEDFVIVGFVPSDLALIEKEDQRISNLLHDQEKCTLWHRLDKNRTTREWAIFPNDNPEEIWIDYLKNNIKKRDAKLTIWQLEALDKFISLLNEDKKKIMAELAARFGKTILYLALFGQLKEQVLVVGSYYLTALYSFKKECYLYEQFSNFVVLDLYSNTFEEDFAYNLSNDKKIVVVVSLCGDKEGNSLRNDNAHFLSKFSNKITVIDEADYGAHTKNCTPFVNLIGNGAPIILTTGTNSERAKGDHDNVDAFFKFTYFDMLMMVSMNPKITNQINYDRAVEFEKNITQVKSYRYGWAKFLSLLSGHELKYNPSLTKASKNVNKNQGFWIGIFQSLIGVSPIMDANDYCLSECIGDDVNCVIQFFIMTNVEMDKLKSIAEPILNSLYDVIVINGNEVKGEDAEQYAKDCIRAAKMKGKKVWIIASHMCQRSFSIPDINVAIITYDNGSLSALLQKISRALTNKNEKKTAHIISLSIDGNRDNKLDSIILDTAKQVAEHEDIDFVAALKKVMKSTPIFQMGADGYNLELKPDDYAREIFSSSSSHRIIMNNNRLMYDGCLDDINFDGNEKQEEFKVENDFKKGKTYLESDVNFVRGESSEEQAIFNQKREKLKQITDRIAYCAKEIRKHKKDMNLDTFVQLVETNQFVSKSMGITHQELKLLIEQKYLDRPLFSTYVGCES